LERAAASLEEAVDALLAALAPRGHELATFDYADKIRILHACWPGTEAEVDNICSALLRFGLLRRAMAEDRPDDEMERGLVLLQQAFRAIRVIGAEPDEGFRTIAVHLCGLLDIAADEAAGRRGSESGTGKPVCG